MLMQSMKVEAIQWTGSGDGIISGGSEVVMWRRKEKSWEIAWSFKPNIPQVLISATWSANGLSATAPCSEVQVGNSSSLVNDPRECVFVYQFDGHSNYTHTELHHPMPVRTIQWRPSIGKPSSRHVRHALRPVLLTCCLDGAVRLWGEIDDGRIRKAGKDNSDQKSTKLNFFVLAVIEVNQSLNGFLGYNVFVSWATEVKGVAVIDDEVCYYSCLENLQHDMAGRCEWLIGLGPERMTTMWAIHCLDDFAPVRFPRVTLWKNQEFVSLEMEDSHLLVHKVLIMRTQVSRPPVVCSFVQLLPCNSFSWTQLYSQASTTIEEKSANDSHPESSLMACAKGSLEVEGHRGKILQIAIHPFSFEVELAASLDENGMLLFWSFSTFFSTHIGLPTSTPSWKLFGKISVIDYSPNYTCLSWAPIMLGMDHILLMGHANGIDCFIVKTSKTNDERVAFHNLISIPFRMESHEQGLSRVSSIPLASNCSGNFDSSKFLLIALWSDCLVALSWEITIHSHDSRGMCSNEHWETYESDFYDKKYIVSVDPCSSVFPVPHKDDKVTCCAVVCPSDLVSSVEQNLTPTHGMGSSCYAYHLVTGCFNGSIKLWRSIPAQSLNSDTNWALAGMLTSQLGPILAVSSSACGQKLATASATNHPTYSNTLCIWECVHVKNAGSFMLEDKLCFDVEIVSFKWLRLGIGQLLLGICLRNELHIYASRRRGGQDMLKCEKPKEGNAWICIAVNSALPAISDFLWGPKGTAIVVHHEYFSLFSHFMSLSDCIGSNEDVLSHSFGNSKQASVDTGGQYQSQPSANMNIKVDLKSIANDEGCQSMFSSVTRKSFWSMSEIAEMLGGPLPLFHPEALLINLCSGTCAWNGQ